MDMYFWGTIAVLFILACAMGWKLDRKRKAGVINGHATEALDGRANAALLSHRNQGSPPG
jgi:hypothetical protein